MKQNSGTKITIITVTAVAALCAIVKVEPYAAIPAGGFVAALLAGLGRQTDRITVWLAGAICLIIAVVFNGISWGGTVLIPSIALGVSWRYFPDRKLRPDDRIYLPTLAIVPGIGLMLLLRQYIFQQPADLFEMTGLNEITAWILDSLDQASGGFSGESREQYEELVSDLKRDFPYYFFGSQALLFTIVMNVVQRYQPGRGKRLPLILFKIRERYVFLLIFAMAVEIFRYLLHEQELLYISRSFFVFLGGTYFLAGLSVVGFFITTRRSRMNSLPGMFLIFVVTLMIVMYPIICAALGLFDIWFDLRKLRKIREV